MAWTDYAAILRRRWWIVVVIVALDVLAGGYLFLKSYRQVGYQGSVTLYVADVSAPSLISAPGSTLDTAGQLLAGETAANFFADDILDVAQSSKVAGYVSGLLQPQHLPNTAPGDIAVSGSRKDRTVNLVVSNPNSTSALAAARALGLAMSASRARFVGANMARRTFVTVVSPASVARTSASHGLVSLALRVILGLLVALGAAFLWDALDPHVRDRRDVEQALGVPVLAQMGYRP